MRALRARLLRFWLRLWAFALVRDRLESAPPPPEPPPLAIDPLAIDPPSWEPAAVELPPDPPQPPEDVAVQLPRAEDDDPGTSFHAEGLQWDMRGAILDRLDEYFACLTRLRTHDPGAYALYSRIGFVVPPDLFAAPQEDGTFTGPRPTYGGVLFPKGGLEPDHDKGNVLPSFIYYRKLKHPFAVQLHRGDVYELTLLYDDRARGTWVSKLAGLVRCHVGFDAAGASTVLRERHLQTIDVPDHRARGRGQFAPSRTIAVRRTVWEVPRWIADACLDQPNEKRDPQRWPIGLLTMALRTHRLALDRIVVRVSRGTCVAVFGIDLPTAPRFFRDRDTLALARDGRRKRIFHHVRKHPRRLADGTTVDVRAHYRGLRSFGWNSYAVHIVLPANTDVYAIDAPGYDALTAPESVLRGGVTEEKLAEKLAEIASA